MRQLAFRSASLVLLFLPTLPAWGEQLQPKCVKNTRECMVAAAQAYLDGLTTHDGSKVPLATNVRRTLNAHTAIEGENVVRKAIDKAPTMVGYRNTRFVVDTDRHEVVYFTLLRLNISSTGPNSGGPRNSGPMTLHLAQRFKVDHGLIEEIESIDFPEMGTTEGTSGWPNQQEK